MKGGNQSVDTLSFLGFYDFFIFENHTLKVSSGRRPGYVLCVLCFRLRKIAFWTRWSDTKLGSGFFDVLMVQESGYVYQLIW